MLSGEVSHSAYQRKRNAAEKLGQERQRAERRRKIYIGGNNINLFTQIKMAVSMIEAAEYYGVEFKRGKALCPFHNDHHPSLFVADDHYYLRRFTDKDALIGAIESYINFYNNGRFQKRLRCMTPMEFHYAYAA